MMNTTGLLSRLAAFANTARLLAFLATSAAALAASPTEVLDDFESYAPGASLHGQSGWEGWANDPAAGAVISDAFAASPSRSVAITGANDLARRFASATNGQWVFSVRQYVPAASTGTNGVILMNRYRPPYGEPDLNWSVQFQCALNTGQVISGLGGGAALPLVKDQWVEIRCEINLDANTVSEFYNGELLSSHPWQGGTGDNAIAALDLFANNAGPVYYDDVRLAPAGPPVITQQPESLTLPAGQPAIFTVTAVGAPPLQFQWSLEDNPILDATNSTLAIGPVSTNLAGTFTVRVSNSGGTVTSLGAGLTVTPDLTGTATGTPVPVDATICFGNAASGAVSNCISDWALLGKSAFASGSYSAQVVHTRQKEWCLYGSGNFQLWGPCNFDDLSDPGIPLPGGGQTGGGGQSFTASLSLLGHNAYWQDHCGPPCWTSFDMGWEPAGFGYVHSVTADMTLGNGDRYIFAPQNSPPLGAHQLPPLCGPCPPETMTICECPTVVELCFVDCLTGQPVAINGDRFQATIVGGPIQASGTLGNNITCRKILLRSGEQYNLTLDYHTGTSYFTDRIDWRRTVPVDTRGYDCNSAGPLPVTVTVGIVEIDDQEHCVGIGPGSPPQCPVSMFGNLNMLCECEHNIGQNWSLMSALSVPVPGGIQQQRYSHVAPNPVCSDGQFNLINLLEGTYNLHGQMCFRTGHNYQWLQTPQTSRTVACNDNLNLGDTFVLDCGWVEGDLFLCGDCVQYLHREAAPESRGSLLNGSSYVAASGPAGGQARAQFPGTWLTGSPQGAFSGTYSLSLGGLNQGASTWTANQLVLKFLNTSPPPGTPYLDSPVTIIDRLFPAQTITRRAHIVNDHKYCFSRVTLNYRVGGYATYTPSLTGSGSFKGTDFLGLPANYAVGVSETTGTGPTPTTPGQVVMCLPEGTYDFSPRVSSGGYFNTLLPVKGIVVGCKQDIEISDGLQLQVLDPPDCVRTNGPNLTIWLTNDFPVTSLTYSVNGGPALPLPGTPVAPGSGFRTVTLPPGALAPCANTVRIEARDNRTPAAVAAQTVSLVFDIVPPTISGCRDVHVTVPAGQTSGNAVLPIVMATDNCLGPVTVSCSHSSGVFPLGVTVVTCTATDTCGNTATCQYEVDVQACVGVFDVQVDCNRPRSDHLVTFTYENPGPDSVAWLYFAPSNPCATVSPGFFNFTTPIPPGGQVTLQFTVNLPANCPPLLCLQFTALNAQLMACCTVERCLELLSVNCPDDIVVDCQDERGAWVEWDQIVATVNGVNLPVTCSRGPGWFPIGVTCVTCTYIDPCIDQWRECQFTVCVRGDGPGVWSRARNDEAQPPTANASQGLGIATDRCGSTVYVGAFDRQIRITSAITLNRLGGRDGYLVKQDPLGTVLWAVKLGTAGEDAARSVVTDDDGFIYLTGFVDGTQTVTFDSWPAIPNVFPPAGPGRSQDIFVACYDANGVFQWLRRDGGTGDDSGIDIALNPQGDPVVVGTWVVNGAGEAFVARYNHTTGASVGSPLWSTGPANHGAVARGVAVDGLGNAYVVGNHAGPSSFPPLTPGLPSGGFIAMANATLTSWVWARETYGNADLRGIAFDKNTTGELFITGYFNGTVGLDASAGGQLTLANTKPASLYDYLLARIEPATGRARWLIQGGGAQNADEETRDIAVDDLGNCYVTGYLHARANSQYVSTGQRVLVASYDKDGHLRWTRHADGGTSPAQAGHSLAVDCARCVHVTGEFAPRLDFPNPWFAPAIPGLSLPPNPVPLLGQTWCGRICPVCPCQDSQVTTFERDISTGWNNAANAWTPPGSNDDDWVWVDTSTGTTLPAQVAGPPVGSPPLAAPISIAAGSPFRLRYCLGLPPGCVADRIEVTVTSANPDPAAIKVYFNSNLIASGPGTPGFSLAITSGFVSNQDCLEIEVNQDYPVTVAAKVSGTCGCGGITGTKFSDLDQDGVLDSGEPGLAGWLITFTDNTGNVVGNALTGASGVYTSPLLFGGTYTVCEVNPFTSWTQTLPPAAGCYTVLVPPGPPVAGKDFGNHCDLDLSLGHELKAELQGGTFVITTLTLTWTAPAILESAPSVLGPWTPVPSAVTPYSISHPPPGAMQYYRVVCP